MKRKKIIFSSFFLFFALFFLIKANFVFASYAEEYKLMEPIPGSSSLLHADLPAYLQAIYKFSIWGVSISALLMITIGGFTYITSAGNTSTAEKGKEIILDAILGIVLIMCAYLILYIINPDLVKINLGGLKVVDTGIESGAREPGDTTCYDAWCDVETPTIDSPSNSDYYSDTEARSILRDNGIGINKSNCAKFGETNCTSLDQIPKIAIKKIINIKKTTGCEVVITGGTEYGHKTHRPGQPIVDLRENTCLDSALSKKSDLGTYGISAICATASKQYIAYNCTYKEPSPHYHLVLK